MRRSGYLADVYPRRGIGRQHQVAWPHPAQEPVELFQPLPAVGVRLVLIRGLYGLALARHSSGQDRDVRAVKR